MNCAEFEQLIDAYLDGGLSGSLRLEFDAHRLRCRRCQLTLAMMESIEHVVISDVAPAMSDDFTNRVMSKIERRRPLSVRLRPTRVALVAGALMQAAAVLYLAVVLNTRPATRPAVPVAAPNVAVAPGAASLGEYAAIDRKTELHEELYQDILGRIRSRADAAGINLSSELAQLVRYPLNVSVSDETARASAEANPWKMILGALVPPESEGSQDAELAPAAETDQHSL